MALVSVVMPAFQAETTLGAAISGVLTQTHRHIELIVVDDGSSDRTAEIAAAYGDRVTLIRQENGGTASARNAALRRARGDFIAFCDADDILLPQHVEKALQVYDARAGRSPGRWIVTCEALLLTDQGLAHGRRLLRGKMPDPDRQPRSIIEDNFVGIFALFPRALLREIGDFDPSIHMDEDWHLWIRAVLNGWRIALQPEPHALYRFTPGAKSEVPADPDDQARTIDLAVLQSDVSLSPELATAVDRRRSVGSARTLDAKGGQALRRGDHHAARQHFRDVMSTRTQDRRLRLKAAVVGWVPGMARVEAARQRRIDDRAGRRSMRGEAG